jgi:hypothetical protein
VVWLSVKVAVITASLSVILIFILSVLSGTVSVCGTGVGGTVVGATAGGGLVGAETVTIGVGGTAVGGDVGVGADPQAATRDTARMSTII